MLLASRFALSLSAALALSGCVGQIVEGRHDANGIDLETFDGAVVGYFLPRAEFSAKASYDEKTGAVTITHSGTAKILPDFRERHFAVYRHLDTSSDEVTIELEQNGLLKTVSTTAADQSQQIIKAVGEVAKEFGTFRDAAKIQSMTKPAAHCARPMTVEASYDLTYDGRTKLASHKPRSSASPNNGCRLDLELRLASKPRHSSMLAATAYPATGFAQEHERKPCPAGAVCFRTAGGYEMNIVATLTDGGVRSEPLTDTAYLLAPVRDSFGVLYFNRRAFVSNSTTASFSNGMLTKLTAKDPSAVAAALAIPVEVLKSLTILVRL